MKIKDFDNLTINTKKTIAEILDEGALVLVMENGNVIDIRIGWGQVEEINKFKNKEEYINEYGDLFGTNMKTTTNHDFVSLSGRDAIKIWEAIKMSIDGVKDIYFNEA